MELTPVLLMFNALLLGAMLWFTLESRREQEPRAPKVGASAGAALLLLAALILWAPWARPWVALLFILMILSGLVLLVPFRGNPKALAGAEGHMVDPATRFDERDSVFARNRSLPPDSEVYHRYYKMRPENEERDAERRRIGGILGKPGAIDSAYPPNVAMMEAAFGMVPLFGPLARPEIPEGTPKRNLSPDRATEIVKGLASRLGADLVGVCRADPRWAYSHRGEIFYDNWEDWGREADPPLPFALVIAVEMKQPLVAAAPHTPTVVESAVNYAKGAYISTLLADWFAKMGYRAQADHSRNYTMLMVPLAVEAGLGQLGRQGYLIADRFGPRVRLFAVTTDMELVPDRPRDLGAEEFCARCKKCAESCPSKSLPQGDKVVVRGVEKWKLDEESCFRYWAKVGTDCSVCMAVCPFARPDTAIHRLVRFLVRRSKAARLILPHIDNLIYGRRWKPRRPPAWIDQSIKESTG